MDNVIAITSPRDERVFIELPMAISVTANTHINYYVGTSDIKHNHTVSTDAAMLCAEYYNTRGA